MQPEMAADIIECLPEGRTLFYYQRDDFARHLLAWVIGSGVSVTALKQSKWRSLLQRPPIREALRAAGSGVLLPEHLEAVTPTHPQAYTLSLGTWGSSKGDRDWYQISRRGVNLVLQLNFPSSHDRALQRLLSEPDQSPFNCEFHPICQRGRHTLAWARIDLDWDSGEALIEEIQSDWISTAERILAFAHRVYRRRGMGARPFRWTQASVHAYFVYYQHQILPIRRYWEDIMLTAALWFLREEIGLRRIYYHTWESGLRMKSRKWYGKPPRSLYTKLPARFCFDRTAQGPDFLSRKNRKFKGEWHVHQF